MGRLEKDLNGDGFTIYNDQDGTSEHFDKSLDGATFIGNKGTKMSAEDADFMIADSFMSSFADGLEPSSAKEETKREEAELENAIKEVKKSSKKKKPVKEEDEEEEEDDEESERIRTGAHEKKKRSWKAIGLFMLYPLFTFVMFNFIHSFLVKNNAGLFGNVIVEDYFKGIAFMICFVTLSNSMYNCFADNLAGTLAEPAITYGLILVIKNFQEVGKLSETAKTVVSITMILAIGYLIFHIFISCLYGSPLFAFLYPIVNLIVAGGLYSKIALISDNYMYWIYVEIAIAVLTIIVLLVKREIREFDGYTHLDKLYSRSKWYDLTRKDRKPEEFKAALKKHIIFIVVGIIVPVLIYVAGRVLENKLGKPYITLIATILALVAANAILRKHMFPGLLAAVLTPFMVSLMTKVAEIEKINGLILKNNVVSFIIVAIIFFVLMIFTYFLDSLFYEYYIIPTLLYIFMLLLPAYRQYAHKFIKTELIAGIIAFVVITAVGIFVYTRSGQKKMAAADSKMSGEVVRINEVNASADSNPDNKA